MTRPLLLCACLAACAASWGQEASPEFVSWGEVKWDQESVVYLPGRCHCCEALTARLSSLEAASESRFRRQRAMSMAQTLLLSGGE